jgi:hypothetical protein
MTSPPRRQCIRCRAPLGQPGRRGRPRQLYHSDVCRAAHDRFTTKLRNGIARKEYSLREISSLLGQFDYSVSPSMISEWRNGHSMPSRASEGVVTALEWLLCIPRGHLVRELAGVEDAVAELQRQIARRLNTASDEERLQTIAVWDHSQVRNSLRRIERRIRQRVVATREQVDRYWVKYRVEGGRQAQILPGPGCRLGEVLRGSHGVCAAELRFPRPLHLDEPYEFRYRMSYPHSDIEDFSIQRAVQASLEYLSLGIQCEPDTHLPELRANIWRRTDTAPEETVEYSRSGQREAFLEASNPKPAIYGFTWLQHHYQAGRTEL